MILLMFSRDADSNGRLIVKLKCELSYCGHVYFEGVRPELIYQALMYLKENNSLYCDIGNALENIPNDLLSLSEDKKFSRSHVCTKYGNSRRN